MTVVAILFWVTAALLIYTQVGYGLLLLVLARSADALHRARRAHELPAPDLDSFQLPAVSVIVAAYAEEDVITARVENLLALGYPRELMQIIVACDGSPDQTAARARAAGADVVLELPRGGKVLAQDAAVRAANGAVLAFTDANAAWHTAALHQLVFALHRDGVGYVCGDVGFTSDGGDNQEGIYWRYEMFMRALESQLASITAGNGAIYAVRREAYMELGAIMSHDIAFPFNMVKHGWRALYAPAARASEQMAPTIEGEFRRKRRMASRAWPAVVQGGMFSPRGYSPLYALMIFSHRILRYLSPLLHLVALVTSLVLIGQGWVYSVCAGVQVGVILAAVVAPLVRGRVLPGPLALVGRALLIARYYVLTTASLGVGLFDWLTGARRVTWEPAAGTR